MPSVLLNIGKMQKDQLHCKQVYDQLLSTTVTYHRYNTMRCNRRNMRILRSFVHSFAKVRCEEEVKFQSTRMWANAQPDGRPAEHRWRPLFNAAKFG